MRASHVVRPGFSSSGGSNDEKSLSTYRPMKVPIASAVSLRKLQLPCTYPEWRGRRNAHWPTAYTGLNEEVLSRISESRKVYAARTRTVGCGATSPPSSAPRARVRPMLKYCDSNPPVDC